MRATLGWMLLILLFQGPVWGQQALDDTNRRTITVNGEAVVNTEPDKIGVTFGIETWDPDIKAAKSKNNQILKKAMAAIKNMGIPAREIRTDHLSIEPRYHDNYRKENFIGFFVRNTFAVTLTDPDKVEALVTHALEAGVNYIHGVDFQTTQLKWYREQARELALQAAREKAEKMAEVLGQSAGAPLRIRENHSGAPWGYYSSWSRWGRGRGHGISQNVVQNIQGDGGDVSDTLALGKIAVRAWVTVTFELNDPR